MTAILLVVTLMSVLAALALGAYVLKLTREQRDRSEARATALAEALGGSPAIAAETFVPETPLASAVEAPRGGALFDHVVPASPSPTLLVIPLAGVLIVGLALGAVYAWHRPAVAATTAAPEAAAPLELMALRHARQGDALVISGLVRNPEGGRAISGLTAIAFAFDRDGRFLTSGRATLDFPRLSPGDESPFSIAIPDGAAVGRYRISFRNDSGILPHLDRRGDAPVAPAQASAP